jgi:mono/diheme cytochrome c family protein
MKCSALKLSRLGGLLALVSALGSCDNSKTKIQYVPDMADAPTLKPQENYLEPPSHSVAQNAFLYPSSKEEADATLANPFPADPKVLALGEKMYNTYCTPCHGAGGKGDGSITDVYIKPPDITDPAFAQRKDGNFFYTITFGANIMPAYGHAIQVHERWAIVHYLRKLQGKQGQGGEK